MKTFLACCGVAALLTLCSCGPSVPADEENTGTTPTTTTPTTPPPPAATINPPYTIAASDDLAIFMCHVHQDVHADPVHFAFWWDVRSTFSTVIPSVDWTLERLDGTPQPAVSGTITNLPANAAGGDGHGHYVQWIEAAPGARHQYRLTINPGHTPAESSYANNSYIFEVDVPNTSTPSQDGDLEFYQDTAHVHAMAPDSEYGFHFEARNRLATAIPATKWRLQDPLEGFDLTFDLPAIAAGGTVEAEHDAQLFAPGLHIVTLTLDSTGLVGESDEGNNTTVFYLLVSAPEGSG